MVTTAAPPDTGATALPIDIYSRYYRETHWLARRIHLDKILQEFSVPKEGQYKTGPQLLEDIRRTWDEMPHAYPTMVKDKRRLVLLHQATYHATPLGTAPENWNDKLLMFTGDTVGNQVPQACFLPSLLFAIVPAGVKVLPLQQQVLSLFADDSLENLESVGDDVPKGQYDVINLPRYALTSTPCVTLPRKTFDPTTGPPICP
jgi:hypothetical protein